MGTTDPEDVHTEFHFTKTTKWTFQDPATRAWVQDRLRGRVLNCCAGPTRLDYSGEIVTNDTDETLDVDHHHRVRDLPDVLEPGSFDTIVFDPPWSANQAVVEYEGRDTTHQRAMAAALHDLLTGDGQVLAFGYRGHVMPSHLGYQLESVGMFDPLGNSQLYAGTQEVRRDYSLGQF